MNEALLTCFISVSDVNGIFFNSGPSLGNIPFLVSFSVRQLVVLFYLSEGKLSITNFDAITSSSVNLSFNLKNASIPSRKKSQFFLASAFVARCKEQSLVATSGIKRIVKLFSFLSV